MSNFGMYAVGVIFLLLCGGILTLELILLRNAIRSFRAGKHWRGILAVIVAVGIGVLVYDNWPSPVTAIAYRTECQSHLHQLDLALEAHCYPSGAYYPNYPTNLADMNPDDILPKQFICWKSGNRPGDLTNVMEWTDYIYVSGFGPSAPAEVPVLICPPMFHRSGGGRLHRRMGGNMLMGDHSCNWYPDSSYIDQLIADPLAFCPNAPASLRSNIYVHVSKRITEQSKGKYRSHGLK